MSTTFTSMNTLRIFVHLITALDFKVCFLSLQANTIYSTRNRVPLSSETTKKVSDLPSWEEISNICEVRNNSGVMISLGFGLLNSASCLAISAFPSLLASPAPVSSTVAWPFATASSTPCSLVKTTLLPGVTAAVARRLGRGQCSHHGPKAFECCVKVQWQDRAAQQPVILIGVKEKSGCNTARSTAMNVQLEVNNNIGAAFSTETRWMLPAASPLCLFLGDSFLI